jgi:uncharacterized iron-regulated protein
MKLLLSLIILFSFSFQPPPPEKPAYKIFTKDAELSSYEDIINSAKESDIIFFGEHHNNPISHWLELEIIKSLNDSTESNSRELKIGTEMFDSDKQRVINEYLLGLIREKDIASSVKTPKNYKTDYLPILRYAKENNLAFYATNIPRRYASKVARDGFSALDTIAKYFPENTKDLPELPIDVDLELPLYKEMSKMGENMKSHGVKYMAEAQASKDAAMSGNILREIGDGRYFHFNGTYHTKDYEGIIWFIQKARPELKIISITTVEQESLDSLTEEHIGSADFIIVVASSMTKTY